jgi:sulfopyruvate decarboxylase subunit beta
MTPEGKILDILKRHRVDFIGALPCDRNKKLYDAIVTGFKTVELSREEEGVGICAGALMAGARPAMFIQNSGLGNMINALASMSKLYSFALPIFMSWRGMESETIDAQKWMGEYVPKIMETMDIPYHEIRTLDDIDQIDETLGSVYENNEIRGYLMEPALWKGSEFESDPISAPSAFNKLDNFDEPMPSATLTRYELLEKIGNALEGKVVACNLGIPCKELYKVCHQPSNFYMLGSMGMVTPVALGMALCTDKQVISIDGDGSVLMNPSTLATIARMAPKNLTVLLVDNGAYGSTGNQLTATTTWTDLAKVARGFGIEKIVRTADPDEVAEALGRDDGPLIIHAICKAGNADVPNLTLTPEEIRGSVTNFLIS